MAPSASARSKQLLADRELADPPTAARLARLSGGRPGVAVAYAASPESERIRVELTRTLLDLLGRRRAARLAAAKDLLAQAMTLGKLLEPPPAGVAPAPRARSGRARAATEEAPAPADTADGAAESTEEPGGTKATAAERRKALVLLLEIWRDLARDLACVQGGATHSVRETALLEELEATASAIPAGAAGATLARLIRAGELLDVNATPELVLDVLLVRWTADGRAP